MDNDLIEGRKGENYSLAADRRLGSCLAGKRACLCPSTERGRTAGGDLTETQLPFELCRIAAARFFLYHDGRPRAETGPTERKDDEDERKQAGIEKQGSVLVWQAQIWYDYSDLTGKHVSQ